MSLLESKARKKEKLTFRTISLSIFKEIFIISSYFYISEGFGSISTPFLTESTFSIQFSIALFLLTFFSFLAGPIHGFFSGFLGELLYQTAYYSAIHFEWCFIVGLIGLLAGIYKYKPLKYHHGMKVYYTFLILLISSFLLMFLIIGFELTQSQGTISFDDIFINIGFKYFMMSLISIVFTIPISLIIYDKVLASKERQVYWTLLTHHTIAESDHTFHLKFGRTRFYFCSRCSGVVIGVLIATFITHYIELVTNAVISPEIAVILCIFLPLIGMIDWGTQRLMFRKSTTRLRIFTGLLIGSALHFLYFTSVYYVYMIIIIAIYFGILFLLIYLGNRKLLKEIRKETNELERG